MKAFADSRELPPVAGEEDQIGDALCLSESALGELAR